MPDKNIQWPKHVGIKEVNDLIKHYKLNLPNDITGIPDHIVNYSIFDEMLQIICKLEEDIDNLEKSHGTIIKSLLTRIEKLEKKSRRRKT